MDLSFLTMIMMSILTTLMYSLTGKMGIYVEKWMRSVVEYLDCRKKPDFSVTIIAKSIENPNNNSHSSSSNRFHCNTDNEENALIILGSIQFFQEMKLYLYRKGEYQVSVQPILSALSNREQLLQSVLSFIPLSSIMYEGMTFKFESKKLMDGDQKKMIGQTFTLTMEGKDLSCIQAFITDRLKEHVKLIYPVDIDKQYIFKLRVPEDKQLKYLDYDRMMYQSRRTFASIFFPQKDLLLKTLDQFLEKHGPWDSYYQLPHKLIVLLEGLPGTSKTSIIKALAFLTKRHVFLINAGYIKNDAMLSMVFTNEHIYFRTDEGWTGQNIPLNKRLYVFEDIDCTSSAKKWLFNRDQITNDPSNNVTISPSTLTTPSATSAINLATDNHPTLSGFLNTLDGICELNGCLAVITTNKAECFDPALFRPGRIDLRITMTFMTIDNILEFIAYYYRITLDVKSIDIITSYMKEKNFTGSQIQEICQRTTFESLLSSFLI